MNTHQKHLLALFIDFVSRPMTTITYYLTLNTLISLNIQILAGSLLAAIAAKLVGPQPSASLINEVPRRCLLARRQLAVGCQIIMVPCANLFIISTSININNHRSFIIIDIIYNMKKSSLHQFICMQKKNPLNP